MVARGGGSGSGSGGSGSGNGRALALGPGAPIPRVIEVGLHTVLELIKETQIAQPALCGRALSALFDILQGLDPEELRAEPRSFVGKLLHQRAQS